LFLAKPPHRTILNEASSMMHEDRKQQNDRQRDSNQPKQRTFSERHRSLIVPVISRSTLPDD
jgi:hypothetical protein